MSGENTGKSGGGTRLGIGRRTLIKSGLAAGAAVATNIPLVNIARAASNVIRIGHIDTLTGPRGDFGEASPWVLGKVRDHLKNGLKVRGKTYQVEILSRDSQSDPNRVASIGNELILRENVDLLLTGDGISVPALEMCDANGTPAIQTMTQLEPFYSARNSGPDKGFPWSFIFFWTSAGISKQYMGNWNEIQTNKTVGSFFVDIEFAISFGDALSGDMAKAGFKEIKGGNFKQETDDFSAQIAKFKNGNCDIVTGLLWTPNMATFWRQARQAGLKPEAVTLAAALLFPSGPNSLGDQGDGMSTEVWWTPNWPYKSSITGQTARQFTDEWTAATGKQWTQPQGYNHALWEVGLEALTKSADPKDREAVRHSIQNLNMETIVGKVNFKDSKYKSAAETELAAGQWRKAKSGKFKYDLLVTYNGQAPDVPIQSEFVKLSKLQNY
jgi:branched-chain amino acid transport system substrate-binding protein